MGVMVEGPLAWWSRPPEPVEDVPVVSGVPGQREYVAAGWVIEDAMRADRMLAERAGVGVDVPCEGRVGSGE